MENEEIKLLHYRMVIEINHSFSSVVKVRGQGGSAPCSDLSPLQ